MTRLATRVLIVAVALLVAGCSCSATTSSTGTSDLRPAGTAGTAVVNGGTAPKGTIPAPPVERYTGTLDGFYRVPDPLPPGNPGDLIRVQPLKSDATTATVRVMYHSRDARDRDRAVTGTITYPKAAPPKGGWPVVAWAHGTTGLSTTCAPSRLGNAAPGFGLDAVRVATDYIGLGPIGERHAYLSGASEAHSVIDAVRAAGHLDDTQVSDRWVAVGHSQGGHAALFTNELAADYAPELRLLGTAAVAPASVFEKTFGPDDQAVPRLVGALMLYGLATDHPELRPDDYVSPEVAARAGVIDTGCLDDVATAFGAVPAATFYTHVPVETEPARSIIRANDPGQVRAKTPLLLVYGTGDTYIVPDRVLALYEQLCATGQVTKLVRVDGANHGVVLQAAGRDITSWFEDRLHDAPAPDSCGP